MKKIIRILAIILLLLGIGMLLYPFLSEKKVDYRNSKLKDEYEKEIFSYNKEEINKLFEDSKEYNKKIYGNGQLGLSDPFEDTSPKIDLEDYGIKNGLFGFISIPKIKIELPLFLGTTDKILSVGAGVVNSTSIPIGGENTNSVIAAHRGFKAEKMFKYVSNLNIGDEIVIRNPKEILKYKIIESKIILPNELENVKIQEGKDLITLSTCHPYTKNTHRYIVIAARENNDISLNTNKEIKKMEDSSSIEIEMEDNFKYIGLFVVIAIILYVIIKYIKKFI